MRVRHAGLSVGADKFEAFDNVGPGDPKYKVTYLFKGENVTTRMANGNFKFGTAIEPNESTPVLRIRVKARNDAPGGTGGFSVTTRSGTDPSAATRDTVKVATNVVVS